MTISRPVDYSVAHHAGRIFRSDEYKKAAASLGLTVEQFQNDVAAELKRLVAEEHAQELVQYESALAPRAIAAAVEKAKAKKEAA
jgi:hypothetical protein